MSGATGLVGKTVLEKLLLRTEVSEVYIIGRRKIDSPSNKIKFIKSDLETFDQFPEGVDVGYCFLGTTIKKAGSREEFKRIDVDLVLSFAKKCKSAKIPNFSFVSAIGANSGSSLFYNRCKGEAEKGLMSLNFTSLNIFRPSLLIGDRDEFRFGETVGIGLYNFFNAIPGISRVLGNAMGTKVGDLADKIIAESIENKVDGCSIFSKF